MASATLNYGFPYPLPTDPVDFTGDFKALADALDDAITGIGEISQDSAALMITSASHVNGISASYNDATNKLTFTLAQNIATSASPTFGSITLNGFPTATTAQIDDNSTRIATTQFVIGQGYVKAATASASYLSSSNTSAQSGYFGDIYLYDDSVPSNYLQVTNSANLTAARSLSINVNDGNRTITLSGDITTGNSFTTSGNFPLTLTTTATTNVTLPTSGTLATLSNKFTDLAAVTSSDLAGKVSDETGTGSLVFATSPALAGTPTSTTASVDTNTTQIATTAFVVGQGYLKTVTASTLYAPIEQYALFELTRETENVSAGSSVFTFRAPYAVTLTKIPRAALASDSNANTVIDINVSGSSIFTTNLSIDATEKTSFTAATPAVLGTTSIPEDAEISFDVDSTGSGGKGLKVILYYKRT